MNRTVNAGHVVGYCTNVHAGEDLDRYLSSLERYSLDVKARISNEQPLAVGLWLSARTARQMLAEDRLGEFRDFLECNGLTAFTMNGFPYGDFHGETVKYQVYRPDWTQAERLNHTINLIRILTELMPEGSEAGISTLPLGWPRGEFDYDKAVGNLLQVAEVLRIIELQTSKLIHLDIEPEPGCILSSSRDVVSFFKNHLLRSRDDSDILRYIRVCHDICHASVTFEDQETAVKNYADSGIRIGKVHVSSALHADISADNFQPVFEQLRTFQEDRYLHQTYIRQSGRVMSYDDLPEAISNVNSHTAGALRCHFHLPIFIEKFGHLKTTSHEIVDCLKNIRKISDCRHFEIETYAWTVLPDELRTDDLAGGIAKELLWMQGQLAKLDGLDESNPAPARRDDISNA
ncbi:MAG: metabolite traffic protein EboE [Planctomycetota bacterium]